MIELLLSLAVVISFLVTYFGLRSWIIKCKKVNLVWEDMNKFGKPKNVAGSGGIVVLIGFLLGALVYVAIRTFLTGRLDIVTLNIFSLLTVITIAGITGLVDDFLGWHKGGLSAKVRILLAFIAAIPLIVINAGESTIALPFFGSVNLGLIYPLILIPVGIAATTTVYNFLAGFNGLEAGLGVLVIGFLSYVSFVTGSAWLALVGVCMIVSLLAFWIFNKTPAKVFPGDVLTYSVGALIGTMAILGNFEKVAAIVFIPFIIEMILKVRGGMKPPRKQSFGIPQKDGSLKLPYDRIYGLTHFSIWFLSKFKKKVYENDVVYFIYLIQFIFIIIGLLML
jgi:UDP-N-acetylglucosamine--dolichyl-phosphate N-acetylglucosaminephosphotransferase